MHGQAQPHDVGVEGPELQGRSVIRKGTKIDLKEVDSELPVDVVEFIKVLWLIRIVRMDLLETVMIVGTLLVHALVNDDSLVERYTGLKNRYDEVTALIVQKRAGQQRMHLFLEQLERTEHISDFDEMLWLSMIDYVTVYGKEDIRFTFKNGMEIAI